MIAKGIDTDRSFVCGLPVRKAIRVAADSTGEHRKEILIMGGGIGLRKNIENFLTNFKFRREIHVTIVTGKASDFLNGSAVLQRICRTLKYAGT